ncbi:MAG: adenine deaminase C-terminal domain-containing protein, partial [Candidatus Dormibacteraceae bacterium]
AVARGFGLRDGALASTVSHDCHQLTVVGRDPRHMLAAARRCDEIGGGIVLVEPGGETAEIRLPVSGLVSDRPAAEVAEQVGRFRHRVTSVGLPDDNSFMLIVSLTLAVIPEAKVTDLGLLDVAAQKLVPLVLEEV